MLEDTEIEAKLKQLDEQEGWKQPQSQMRIDEFWNPSKEDIGREFKGLYLETRTFTNKNDGSTFENILLMTPDKKIWGITKTTVLESELSDINQYDGLYLKYNGKKKVRKGQGMYHDFEIMIKRMGIPSEDNGNSGPTMNLTDDTEIKSIVDELREVVISEGGIGTLEEIAERAKQCHEDTELSDKELSQVLKFLADKVQESKNK